jgi:phage terminase large subunit-like protein
LHNLRDWRKNKLITVLNGNVIDPRQIEDMVIPLKPLYDIQAMAYDRYNATSTALSVQEKGGVPALEFPQTTPMFTEPTKAFRDMVLQERFNHGMNPIAQWMMRNAVPIMDTNGNIKITKVPKRAPDKVDGVVSGIMAMAAWMMDRNEQVSNVYDSRGILELREG